VGVTLRRVLPVPARDAFAVLGDWEAPFMARSSAGVAVKSVDYSDLPAAAPLRPGALRELVRTRERARARGGACKHKAVRASKKERKINASRARRR
jgi:hypothetical protein